MFRVPGRLDDIKKSLDNMNPDGSMKKTSITRLDVRFSNLCNAACLHCGAVASSKWYDEHYGFFGEEYSHKSASKWSLILDEHGRPRPANPRNTDDMPGFWRTLEEHKETINYVIILGGEPLIMPEHESLLNFFIHHGTSANVVLFYHTNLSVVNKKLIDLWKKFKRVDLSVSIDDIGSNYELIRHGLSWNKLNSNIETLRDNGIELLNLSICYMIPNMLRLREIDEWYDSKGYAKSMKFVHEPFYMTVNSLPRSAREELININRSHGTTFALESANWIEQQIDQPGDPAACDQFVRFMDYLDKSRKQDWRSALKETADFLKRYDIG
jgi:hypothetical protein